MNRSLVSSRHEIWRLWNQNKTAKEISDKLSLNQAYVTKKMIEFDRLKNLDKNKEQMHVEVAEIKNSIFQNTTEVNPFVLITTNAEVIEAYNRMVNGRNIDLLINKII